MPLFHHFYIYPSFTRELLKNTENEAIRSASHLMRILFETNQNSKIIITDKTEEKFHMVIKDFVLLKIKVFSDS